METAKKDWINPIELNEEFGITITTQNRLRRERKLPFSRIGRQIRYSRERINKWFEEHQVV